MNSPESDMSTRFSRPERTSLSTVVLDLQRRSQDELDPVDSVMLLEVSHGSLMDWISSQRMTFLPAEGAIYDSIWTLAELFVDRWQSFQTVIEEFADDAELASQLAYGYCGMLLELGSENGPGLVLAFSFFNDMTKLLENQLSRLDLISANREVHEEIVLALSDLLTLISSVSIYVQQGFTSTRAVSGSVDIYETYAFQIQTFRKRCQNIAFSMFRHQLQEVNVDGSRLADLSLISTWLASNDRVLAGLAENSSRFTGARGELTCLWISPYIARFLRSPRRTVCFFGSPGSGRSVLASVIAGNLQGPFNRTSYDVLFIAINASIPAGTTPRSIALALLNEIFTQDSGNILLYQVLSDAFERSQLITSPDEYENILWSTLHKALGCRARGSRDLVLIVDGIDEASCGELAMLQKLTSVVSMVSNIRLIVLGAQKPSVAADQMFVEISEDLVYDDIATVLRQSQRQKSFTELSEFEQEAILDRITGASCGSFLWATLVAKRACVEAEPDGFSKAVDRLVSAKPSITDLVFLTIQNSDVSTEAKQMLLWSATAERPLHLKELHALACVSIDKHTVNGRETNVLHTLDPLRTILFSKNGLLCLRHGIFRQTVLDIFSQGKLAPTGDRHADLATRLLIYIDFSVTERNEPSASSLSPQEANILLEKYPLLDFALRYWPIHFRNTAVFRNSGPNSAFKEFAKVVPISTTFVRLQSAIWDQLPKCVSIGYQEMLTDIYREVLGVGNMVTLQCVILLAVMYRQLNKLNEAIPLFYQAAIDSSNLLTTSHTLTAEMVSAFLSLANDKISGDKTDLMMKRGECLLLSVECSKTCHGSTSEKHIAALSQLNKHYHMIADEQQAQDLMKTIESIVKQRSLQ